jgi:chromosomal replication initiator protein
MARREELATQAWEAALELLRSKPARPGLLAWLKNLHPLSLEKGVLTLGVPSEFSRDWLEKRGAKAIRAALEEVVGGPVQLGFDVFQRRLELEVAPRKRPRQRDSLPDGSPGAGRPLPGSGRLLSTPLNPKYTFEDFVVGKGNRFAHAAALAVAKNPAKSYNPLFIYGGVGLGKTHLMQAIGHHVREAFASCRVEYVSGDTFTYEVVTSIREDRFQAFRNKYRPVDVWLVDDIQFIAAKERTESEFFQTFNALHETGRQIVITSDRPPRELQVMDDRLRSRFEWGLIADIKPPDLETRIAILERRARAEGATLAPEVIAYVAKMINSNIRLLEGALTKLLAASSFSGAEITLGLAMEHLKDHSLSDQTRPLTLAQVQEAVARHFQLTIAELTAAKRTRDLVFARQVAMYLCRELVKSSFPEIARRFGGRDHSTVIHACTKIRNETERDGKVRMLVGQLREELEARI